MGMSNIIMSVCNSLYLNGVTVNSEANARRIALVEGCFGSAGQPLCVPGRVLVGEGVLTKACRKKVKPRQLFLFNDLLVYGNIIINKKKYNTQHIIPLEDVKLKSLEDDGQFKNGWLICTRGKSFAVYAATATEKQEWMAHINKCIEDLLKKSGKKASDSFNKGEGDKDGDSSGEDDSDDEENGVNSEPKHPSFYSTAQGSS